MKKLALASTLVALVTVAPAYAAAPIPSPEPSSFVQVAAGLFVLGCVAVFVRKRVSRNGAE
jgi:hypothetical protein